MDYLCSAWNKVRSLWTPNVEKPCLLEPLNPRVKIMDPPPTLRELEKHMTSKTTADLTKVVYFYKPKDKVP